MDFDEVLEKLNVTDGSIIYGIKFVKGRDIYDDEDDGAQNYEGIVADIVRTKTYALLRLKDIDFIQIIEQNARVITNPYYVGHAFNGEYHEGNLELDYIYNIPDNLVIDPNYVFGTCIVRNGIQITPPSESSVRKMLGVLKDHTNCDYALYCDRVNKPRLLLLNESNRYPDRNDKFKTLHFCKTDKDCFWYDEATLTALLKHVECDSYNRTYIIFANAEIAEKYCKIWNKQL